MNENNQKVSSSLIRRRFYCFSFFDGILNKTQNQEYYYMINILMVIIFRWWGGGGIEELSSAFPFGVTKEEEDSGARVVHIWKMFEGCAL